MRIEDDSRMTAGAPGARTSGSTGLPPTERSRASVWFAVAGDARFLSHRDTLRMWERTLRRSRAPLRYSQGFNPHVRLRLPLPRSVGTSSRLELLELELREPFAGDDWVKRLQPALPAGLEVLGVEAADVRSALSAPEEVSYRVRLAQDVDLEGLDERIRTLEQAKQWLVERARRGRHPARTINLCEHVRALRREGPWLCCTMVTRPEGTARMDELLKALGLEASAEVERTGATYPAALGRGISPPDETPAPVQPSHNET